MAILLDTSCFIGLEWRRLPLAALPTLLPSMTVALASVTASELLVGVHLADTEERKARRSSFVESVLETIPIIPFDLRCARVHAQLRAVLRSEGLVIGAHDLLIAATGLSYGFEIATDNTRDFNRIPGVRVNHLDWSSV